MDRAQVAFGFRKLLRAVLVAGPKQQLRLDGGLLRPDMELVGEVVETAILARVVLIKDLANIVFDGPDDGALRLQCGIARDICRARLFDQGLLGRVELGGLRSARHQARQCQAPEVVHSDPHGTIASSSITAPTTAAVVQISLQKERQSRFREASRDY
jgi:hypothetical protein